MPTKQQLVLGLLEIARRLGFQAGDPDLNRLVARVEDDGDIDDGDIDDEPFEWEDELADPPHPPPYFDHGAPKCPVNLHQQHDPEIPPCPECKGLGVNDVAGKCAMPACTGYHRCVPCDGTGDKY